MLSTCGDLRPHSNFKIHQVFNSAIDIMSSPISSTPTLRAYSLQLLPTGYQVFKDAHNLSLKGRTRPRLHKVAHDLLSHTRLHTISY